MKFTDKTTFKMKLARGTILEVLTTSLYRIYKNSKYSALTMAGTPQAPRVISNNVMTVNMLQALEVIPTDIYDNMHNRMMWLQWLATHRLIRKNIVTVHNVFVQWL